jgi:hypothetical protein
MISFPCGSQSPNVVCLSETQLLQNTIVRLVSQSVTQWLSHSLPPSFTFFLKRNFVCAASTPRTNADPENLFENFCGFYARPYRLHYPPPSPLFCCCDAGCCCCRCCADNCLPPRPPTPLSLSPSHLPLPILTPTIFTGRAA